MKLSIVIPVYNEENTITQLINNVKSVEICHDKEIIVVDDGCTDGTSEILDSIKNNYKKGYGYFREDL